MKRTLAILLALLLCAVSALAEINYSEETLADGSILCHFEDLTITLPADWDGKVIVKEEGSGPSFYQAASYEAYLAEGLEGGGFLFGLGASVNGSFSELPAFKYLGFSEESVMNYYMQLPSDYPAWMEDEAIRAEYDAMLAQVDAIAETATIDGGIEVLDGNDLAEEPEAAESDESAEAEGPTLAQLRYYFEHNALPRYFYEDPANTMDVLAEVGAFTLFASLGDENGIAYDYTEADFGQNLYAAADGTRVLQLDLPRPEVSPQCFRLYMFYNPDTQAAAYYTIEYENLLGESAMLCGWDADGTHRNYGGADVPPEKGAEGYDDALYAEAVSLAEFAGVSTELEPIAFDAPAAPVDTAGLALIECSEQGFTVMADPAYAWDYQEGTGVSIYTESEGSIPYVIVYRSEDLLAEPLEFIKEQFTPHMAQQYGDDLVSTVEYELYDIGGKSLPAGLYTYRLQGYLIDMLRIYDSTGDHTVTYTAKYVQGEGDATLAALDAAVRTYQAQ